MDYKWHATECWISTCAFSSNFPPPPSAASCGRNQRWSRNFCKLWAKCGRSAARSANVASYLGWSSKWDVFQTKLGNCPIETASNSSKSWKHHPLILTRLRTNPGQAASHGLAPKANSTSTSKLNRLLKVTYMFCWLYMVLEDYDIIWIHHEPKIRMMGNQALAALAAQLLSCKIGQKISKARRFCKRTLVFPTSYQKAYGLCKMESLIVSHLVTHP